MPFLSLWERRRAALSEGKGSGRWEQARGYGSLEKSCGSQTPPAPERNCDEVSLILALILTFSPGEKEFALAGVS